jgi:hypothetical protein
MCRCIYSVLATAIFLLLAAPDAMGQPTPYGDQFMFSATNFPDSFGVTRDPEFQVVTDHGTPPVTMTFDGVPEVGGGMTVNERAVVWPGLPGGINAFHAFLNVSIDLVIWENPGEVLEFSFTTVDGEWISDNPGAPSALAVAGLDWPHATTGTQPALLNEDDFGQGAFYLYFTNDGVPLTNMAIQIDTGIVVGEHPFDPSIPEVAYILYSNGQIDDVTDFHEGGMDLLSGSSQLDPDGELPDTSNWATLSTIMALGATPGDGFHIGFHVVPTTDPVALPGDFDGNGVIDNLDFNILRNHFQSPGAYPDGDMDFNGFIDLHDFAAFKAAFEAANPAPVPEPATLVLIMAGGLLYFAARRRALFRF